MKYEDSLLGQQMAAGAAAPPGVGYGKGMRPRIRADPDRVLFFVVLKIGWLDKNAGQLETIPHFQFHKFHRA